MAVGEAVVPLPPQIIHLKEFNDEARECGRLTDRALSSALQQLCLRSPRKSFLHDRGPEYKMHAAQHFHEFATCMRWVPVIR